MNATFTCPKCNQWNNGWALAQYQQCGACKASIPNEDIPARLRGTPRPPDPGTKTDAHVDQICFTQSTIKDTFTDGKKVSDTIEALKSGGVEYGQDIPVIRVFKDSKGKLWALDNRRLFCLQNALKYKRLDDKKIQIIVYDYYACDEKVLEEFQRKMTSECEGKGIRVKDGLPTGFPRQGKNGGWYVYARNHKKKYWSQLSPSDKAELLFAFPECADMYSELDRLPDEAVKSRPSEPEDGDEHARAIAEACQSERALHGMFPQEGDKDHLRERAQSIQWCELRRAFDVSSELQTFDALRAIQEKASKTRNRSLQSLCHGFYHSARLSSNIDPCVSQFLSASASQHQKVLVTEDTTKKAIEQARRVSDAPPRVSERQHEVELSSQFHQMTLHHHSVRCAYGVEHYHPNMSHSPPIRPPLPQTTTRETSQGPRPYYGNTWNDFQHNYAKVHPGSTSTERSAAWAEQKKN